MSYARTAVTRMTLDMSRPDLQRSETVTLGDTNRRWEVTLINGGAPFRLPPNWTAALTGIKPDGTGLLNGCSVADGKIVYDFAAGAEIATCVGSYPVQFDIWDEVGELVASPKVYVNVLADVRPRAELESDGQYTQIGVLIGRVNQTEADVGLLGETALAQGDDIAALKKKVTTAGIVTVSPTQWTDDDPQTAMIGITNLRKGSVALIMPADEQTKTAATMARLTARTYAVESNESMGVAYLVKAEAATAPTMDLRMLVLVIQTGSEADARVSLIGVDAYNDEADAELADHLDRIERLEKSVTAGIVTVSPTQWTDDDPQTAMIGVTNLKKGSVALIMPADELTKAAATIARLTAKTYAAEPNESMGVAYLVKAEAATAPTMDLHMLVLVIQTGSDEDARVSLIGVDAYNDEADAELADHLDRIERLEKSVTAGSVTAGIVTVSATQWTDNDPQTAMIGITNLRKGSVALIMPADEPTKIAATAARLSAKTFVAGSNESIGVAYLVRAEAETAPVIDLRMLVLVIQTGSDEDARVALIGVDAYGDGSVDETAVRELIRKIVPSWALNSTPPADAVQSVNGKTGAVSLYAEDVGARPASWTPTAADVGAEINGTASALLSLHNVNVEAHNDLRLELADHRAEVNALLNSDDETLNETKEIVAYIKSNKGLIDAITTSKVNVTDIEDNLVTNVSNKPLSAAQGVALKDLIDALTEVVSGKQTEAQVTAAISSALTSYLTATKAAELYQPKGDYATTTALEQGLKTKQPLGNYLTQHQSLAHLLPKNQGAENAGKIMAVATDGSVTYIPISDLGVSGDLVGNFAEDGSIVLITPLDVGVYDLYTEDGRLYGKMTVEAAKAKYTVTFVADGVPVDVVEYNEGDATLSRVPTVPAKDGYTGVWETYTLNNKNITVNAIYTAIPVEPEFVNLIDEAGYTVGKRISDSADGGEVTSGASKLVLTGHIPVGQYGDVFHVRGVDSLIAPLPSGTADQAGLRSCWDANKVYIDNTVKSYPRELAGTDENGDLTLTYTEAWEVPEGTAYIRMQFYDADGSVPSLIVTRNQLIPK